MQVGDRTEGSLGSICIQSNSTPMGPITGQNSTSTRDNTCLATHDGHKMRTIIDVKLAQLPSHSLNIYTNSHKLLESVEVRAAMMDSPPQRTCPGLPSVLGWGLKKFSYFRAALLLSHRHGGYRCKFRDDLERGRGA